MDSNEGARPSDPRRISNEGAPPADPEDRRRGGGPPWGRIIAALIGLLLLALLIPLACQALRGGGGDPGAGGTGGEQQQGAAEETSNERAQRGGESTSAGDDTEASGSDTAASGAGAAGGDTEAGGGAGGTTGGEVAAGAGAPTASLDSGAEQAGDGTTVTVPRAEISGVDGWIAVHADDGGRPGEVLGHAPLREGENADVAVRLDKPVSSGRLYAMAHADDPDDDRYTFPDGDPPVEADGGPVVEPIQYTVEGEQAGGDLPASGGPPVLPILMIGGVFLLFASGAVLTRRRLGERNG